MPELTDAQKVVRNDTAKRMAAALEALAGTGGRGLPAGGTDGDVLVKNGATDYDATWKKTPPQMGSLATIETSPITSPTGYNVGDYIVYNGQLYYVSKLISPQDPLDAGANGNIEAATVGSALTSAIDVRQIQFSLPAAVTLTKQNAVQILFNFDLKTAGLPAGAIPDGKTLIGAVSLWTNSYVGAGIVLDSFVNNGLLSVAGAPTTVDSVTVSSLRILTFWK